MGTNCIILDAYLQQMVSLQQYLKKLHPKMREPLADQALAKANESIESAIDDLRWVRDSMDKIYEER